MPQNVQADRPLTIDTPLGKDKVLLIGLSGREGVSRLFGFQLDLMAEKGTDVAFDKLLGQKVTAHLSMPKGVKRHFNGRCVRISQGEQDVGKETFISYRMEIVPDFWMLTRKAQSRIFQQLSVPDILKKVLVGLDVTYEIQGTFHPRDFCVQYRETDFNFACRLMEEEGIYYFFKHTDGNHTMVVANTPQSHPDVPGPTQIIYEDVSGGFRDEDRIYDWEKVQEWRSGKYTLWDHSFELPHKHLETEKLIQDSVTVGKASHKLKVSGNDKFEVYDWPGEYAQRFDGVDPGGGDQPGELQHIFEDNKRTVEIRMQEEALGSLLIQGGSNCRHFMAGHKFSLQRHFSGEGGPYVLTSVQHTARGSGDYRGSRTGKFEYRNEFTCIPQALPFRPPRTTPKPVVHGTQSAVVVGPAGEEIFTDKYSRVKVQFHWDREGKNDSKSSCWIRVGTPWAGKQWGMIHIPRIGQEVIVDFLEGDPDQPIIIGSVYNADMMPPYGLPGNKTQSGIKSRSSLKGDPSNFNEFRFEDKKGSEQVFLHAERNQDIEVEKDETHWVGHDRTKTIDHDEQDHIKNDWTIKVDNKRDATIASTDTETVGSSQTIKIGSDQSQTIGGSQTEKIAQSQSATIGINRSATIGASDSLTVGASRSATIGGADSSTVGGALSITTAGATTISAGGATMVTAGGVISITAGGAMTLTAGGAVAITAAGAVSVSAAAITLNGAIVTCAGVLMATAVVAGAVTAPVYSPGLGNMI